MPLSPGFKLGSYEIVCSLGAGGMGEVYRARDSKLKRDVALKVLPADVAGDRERLARFRREAEVLASLNHPHIAHIHGLEESSGTTALVMELVEGEDLAQRIARGPIALDEALPMAAQIAEALEAAHNAGIIHRDLKPANIRVTPDGTVKVLDFGLAKALDTTQSGARNLANSPTITSPARLRPGYGEAGTELGVILGTAAYMSPEQAKGKVVDKRADVWAFGVVLYEMLTGAQLFHREDLSETLAAVLTRDPDLDQLPKTTPESVRRLLVRCLTKDPRRRLDSMRAAWLDIEDAARQPPIAKTTTGGPRLLAVAAVVAILASAAGWALGRMGPRAVTTPATDSPIVAEIPAPSGVLSAFYDGFALSPDAATLAFIARGADGRGQLWLRRIDSAVAQPVPGTEGAQYPFWSPDGAHVAYFGNGKLTRIPIGGGPPQSLADAASTGSFGTWSEHDEILFDTGFGTTGLNLVRAQGGPVRALNLQGRHPAWLTGGRRFLFRSLGQKQSELFVSTVDDAANRSGKSAAIGQAGSDNEYFYSRSGHVFLNRNGTLTVQRFDSTSDALQGTPAVLAGAVGTPRGWFALSAAADTVVALARRSANEIGDAGDPVSRLRWVDRAGTRLEDVGASGRYWMNSVAPDGRRVATHQSDDVWILGGRAPTRLRTTGSFGNVIWSPDGTEVAYTASGGVILKKAIDRDTPDERLTTIQGLMDIDDWSRDGRFLLGHVRAPSGSDVVLFDRQTSSSRTMLSGPANEQHARFSPDGRWLAYQSDASTRPEVYITAIAGRQDPIQVSIGGGMHPVWRRDGKEIYYVDPDSAIMAVPIAAAAGTLTVGAATRLFRIPLNDITLGFISPFDVSPDGQRFLLNVPDAPSSLLYIRGFQRLLK